MVKEPKFISGLELFVSEPTYNKILYRKQNELYIKATPNLESRFYYWLKRSKPPMYIILRKGTTNIMRAIHLSSAFIMEKGKYLEIKLFARQNNLLKFPTKNKDFGYTEARSIIFCFSKSRSQAFPVKRR